MTNSTELTIIAEAPARGAGLNQVIGLSIAAVVITLVLLWVGYAHRTHRISSACNASISPSSVS